MFMRKRISIPIWFFITLAVIVPPASAVTFEAEDIRLGINGYVNGLYTYMSKMPTAMGDTMPDTSTFETDNHLLFNAAKDRLRVNLNLEYDNGGFVRGGDMGSEEITGDLGILEGFGEYAFSKPIQVRVGNFLSPFGIYNQVRYITPLFATVVLPMMYDPPENYEGAPLIPENANGMFFGSYTSGTVRINYYLYGGNGEINSEGKDVNKDKGFGGRIKLILPYNLKIGGSYYTVEDDSNTEGRENLYGADLAITIADINLQAEYAIDNVEKVKDRFAYYARLTYSIDKFIPFIGYDYFKDESDMLFERGLRRCSLGTGYNVNNYITLKAEYHYHKIDDTGGLMMGLPDDVQMFRGAAIFIF